MRVSSPVRSRRNVSHMPQAGAGSGGSSSPILNAGLKQRPEKFHPVAATIDPVPVVEVLVKEIEQSEVDSVQDNYVAALVGDVVEFNSATECALSKEIAINQNKVDVETNSDELHAMHVDGSGENSDIDSAVLIADLAQKKKKKNLETCC
ncbi:hypothetical protein ACOSP7_018525 [Xanthoceras sorbifolium]